MTAKVAWLTAPGRLEFRHEELPPPQPGEMLCETIVTAISPGTELAAYTGKPPLRPSVVYPRLQGYCSVARVLESSAEGFSRGDRVLSFASHRSHLTLPAGEVLLKLPDEADAGKIACTYLYHLGYNAVLRSGVRPGSRVLVIGLGALGLTSVTMACIAGADVHAISDQARPAAIASLLGAQTWRRDQERPLQEALDGGADVVITTVSGWDDWQRALRLAGQNATLACLGFPGRGEPPPSQNPFDSQYFYMKQLRIEAVGWSPEVNDNRGFLRFNERENIAWLASLIWSGRLDPASLVSGTYDGLELGQAYEDLLMRRNSAVTYLLKWAA
ncbi:zinc-binding alcohol dehydrogenase [Sphingomonas sp. CGMCC 1.13658]|nr:zinc-binding alcohol dehydrogenase [Sphingomonas sp. CGMCC 1.13658]